MDRHLAEQEGYDDGEGSYRYREEEEEDSREDEEDGRDEVQIISPHPVRVSPGGATVRAADESVEKGRWAAAEASQAAEATAPFSSHGGKEIDGGWNRDDVDGLFCPICMEAWSNDGAHHPSCLPCGHLYGMSCIRKWLNKQKRSGKCPQCGKKCTLKDVRRIYGSHIVVIDEEAKKRILSLEAQCDSLEKKNTDWHRKEAEWRKREADLCKQLNLLKEREKILELAIHSAETKSPLWPATSHDWQAHMLGSNRGSQVSSSGFVLQEELHVDGARIFDVNASRQLLVVAQRPNNIGVTDGITKMSLISPHCQERISLPSNLKAVKDLHISPDGERVLLAMLGKKLSILSVESNNMVLSYELPAAAWSCSWDLCCSYYMYAGLQNGMLLMFDTRQTARPLESRSGLSCNPVHTIYPLSDAILPCGTRAILTASSVGLCQWNFGVDQDSSYMIPETENQGVCISLAYCPASNHIVSSYRPKVEVSNDVVVSQPCLTPWSAMGPSVLGTHVLVNRSGSSFTKCGTTYGNVPGIRLPKSVIFSMENHHPILASGDEVTSELILQELPSLAVSQRLKCRHPIRDVKYASSRSMGMLSCLNGDHLQLFSINLGSEHAGEFNAWILLQDSEVCLGMCG